MTSICFGFGVLKNRQKGTKALNVTENVQKSHRRPMSIFPSFESTFGPSAASAIGEINAKAAADAADAADTAAVWISNARRTVSPTISHRRTEK